MGYPLSEQFGEFPIQQYPNVSEENQLFDGQRVRDIVNGDLYRPIAAPPVGSLLVASGASIPVGCLLNSLSVSRRPVLADFG
ncbi:hypothetical protein [Haloarcula sp. 1CSR25-25]|uniref:hypothetical protein n=1 Tax=Haloarcula sp. 1CSR25-25 TaxID=2862545 RepID=UPI002894EE49|nr:hypothetical protein [Haloarcula sp. 1CSR25-25]MDT3436498.1 hypothetical protein [Haloarcula sp. 1CSR25-25]